MAGQSGRTNASLSSPSSDPGFVLPFSSTRLNGLRRFFSSFSSPFLSGDRAGRTFRVPPRRLNTQDSIRSEGSVQVPQDTRNILHERRRSPTLLGHWSSDDIYTRRETTETVEPYQQRRNSLDNFNVTNSAVINSGDSVVINMEEQPVSRAVNAHSSDSEESDSGQPAGDEEGQQNEENANGTVRINGESISEMLERHPEVHELLKVVWQYCIFMLIILTKLIFDRFTSILILMSFWLSFSVSNTVVKMVLAQPTAAVTARHCLLLSLMFISVPVFVGSFYFYYSPTRIYFAAILLPTNFEFLTLGDLLWVVIITDYVIKLVTVLLKGIYASIPCVFVHHKQRGKHLALVEITSQLYRSMAPVQPWLSYLLDNYTGIQKVFGVFLSAVYMLCKGPDIIHRIKNFHYVFKKFMEQANYGCTPTQAQLKDTGSTCPICQDNFTVPTMLQCKHIFCEECVARWFDRERTCPMCRTKVADDPKFRDGSTSHAIQVY